MNNIKSGSENPITLTKGVPGNRRSTVSSISNNQRLPTLLPRHNNSTRRGYNLQALLRHIKGLVNQFAHNGTPSEQRSTDEKSKNSKDKDNLQPSTLDLPFDTQEAIKKKLGFTGGFSVKVQSTNENNQLSSGDVAIISGGIAGEEITRITLNESDILGIQKADALTVAEEFEVNLEKWKNSGIHHYSYTFQRSCFCPRDETREIVTNVRNDEATDSQFKDSKQPLSDNLSFNQLSINDLFATIETAIKSNADVIKVSYDGKTGQPTSIYIDGKTGIADDEFSLTAKNLQQIMHPAPTLTTLALGEEDSGELPYPTAKPKPIDPFDFANTATRHENEEGVFQFPPRK